MNFNVEQNILKNKCAYECSKKAHVTPTTKTTWFLPKFIAAWFNRGQPNVSMNQQANRSMCPQTNKQTDQCAHGPTSKQVNVPMDQQANRSMCPWTNKPTDQCANGPTSKQINVPMDQCANRSMCPWTNVRTDQCAHGLKCPITNVPMDWCANRLMHPETNVSTYWSAHWPIIVRVGLGLGLVKTGLRTDQN